MTGLVDSRVADKLPSPHDQTHPDMQEAQVVMVVCMGGDGGVYQWCVWVVWWLVIFSAFGCVRLYLVVRCCVEACMCVWLWVVVGVSRR